MRKPFIDLIDCTGCEGCMAICPEVFRRNRRKGYMEVIELPDYPEGEVDKAIEKCPADCLKWRDEI